MTDKEKIRAEIERLKATYDIDLPHGIGVYTTCETIISFIDSMQEEPVTSVWHEPSEIPEKKKWILLAHKEGWYHVGRLYEGQRKNLVISDGVSTFELNMFNKWVYVDDILKF